MCFGKPTNRNPLHQQSRSNDGQPWKIHHVQKERRRQLSKGEKACSKQGHNFESTACRVLRAMSPRYDLRCQAPEVELVNF